MNSDEGSQSSPSRELSPAEIEALDKALETLNLAAPDASKQPVIKPELRELMDSRVAAEKQDAKKNGWTAQQNRAIDEHRKTDGREDYNARRKATRASKRLDETGQLPRIHTNLKGMPPEKKQEHRRAQVNKAKKTWRDTRTPEQIAEANRKKAEAEKARRKRIKEATQPEGFGKFGNS